MDWSIRLSDSHWGIEDGEIIGVETYAIFLFIICNQLTLIFDVYFDTHTENSISEIF